MSPWGIFAPYLKAQHPKIQHPKIQHPICSTTDKIGKPWCKGQFYGNTPGERSVKNL